MYRWNLFHLFVLVLSFPSTFFDFFSSRSLSIFSRSFLYTFLIFLLWSSLVFTPYFTNFFSSALFWYFYESRKFTYHLDVSFLFWFLSEFFPLPSFYQSSLFFFFFILQQIVFLFYCLFPFFLCTEFSFLRLSWITSVSFFSLLFSFLSSILLFANLRRTFPQCLFSLYALLSSYFVLSVSSFWSTWRLAGLALASKRDTVSQYLDRGSRDLSLLHAGDSIDGPLTPTSCSLSPPSDRSRYRHEWRTGTAAAALSLGSSRFRLREATKFVFVLSFDRLRDPITANCDLFSRASRTSPPQLLTLTRCFVFAS